MRGRSQSFNSFKTKNSDPVFERDAFQVEQGRAWPSPRHDAALQRATPRRSMLASLLLCVSPWCHATVLINVLPRVMSLLRATSPHRVMPHCCLVSLKNATPHSALDFLPVLICALAIHIPFHCTPHFSVIAVSLKLATRISSCSFSSDFTTQARPLFAPGSCSSLLGAPGRRVSLLILRPRHSCPSATPHARAPLPRRPWTRSRRHTRVKADASGLIASIFEPIIGVLVSCVTITSREVLFFSLWICRVCLAFAFLPRRAWGSVAPCGVVLMACPHHNTHQWLRRL